MTPYNLSPGTLKQQAMLINVCCPTSAVQRLWASICRPAVYIKHSTSQSQGNSKVWTDGQTVLQDTWRCYLMLNCPFSQEQWSLKIILRSHKGRRQQRSKSVLKFWSISPLTTWGWKCISHGILKYRRAKSWLCPPGCHTQPLLLRLCGNCSQGHLDFLREDSLCILYTNK